MKIQPLCLKDDWIVNADTGKPLVRIDRDNPAGLVLTVPYIGSFLLQDIVEVVHSLVEENEQVPVLVEQGNGVVHIFCSLACRSRFPNHLNTILYRREQTTLNDSAVTFCEICGERL